LCNRLHRRCSGFSALFRQCQAFIGRIDAFTVKINSP
jgi:hypothetical protein